MTHDKWLTTIQIFRNGKWSPVQEFGTKQQADSYVRKRIQMADQQGLDRRNWAIANFAKNAFVLHDE